MSEPSPTSWRTLSRPAQWMLATLVFDFIGTGLIMPFGVVYLHEVRHIDLTTASALLALPAVVGLIAVGPGGVLIDRFGPRAVVIAAVACEMVAQVLMAFVRDVPLAAISLVLSGLAGGVIFPAVQAMVAAVLPPERRQQYFGYSFTLLNLGIGIGGLLGGAIVHVGDPASFQRIYLIDAATFLFPLAVYLVPLRRYGGVGGDAVSDGPGAGEAKGGYAAVLRDRVMRWLIVLGFVTAFIGYAQFGVGFQAFARNEARISTQALGWAYAVNTFVIVAAQLVVLRLLDGRRRTRALVAMCVLWAVTWAIFGVSALVPGTAAAALLVCVAAGVFGLGETCLQPTLPAMVNDLAPEGLRGRYNSASAGAFHLAEIVGPPFAGLLIGHGIGGWFAPALVLGCFLAAGVAVHVERHADDRVNGVGVPATTADGELAVELQHAKAVAE